MSKKSSETNHENKYDIATGNFSAGGYRLIWIRSDQKTVIDKQSRTESVENVLAELKSLELKLNKRKLRTKIEINKKITSILKGYQCLDIIKYEIQSHRHYDKGYGKKGRPSPDEKGTLTWEQSFSLIFFVDQISFDAAAMMDGVFPIVTNLAEDKKSAKDILEICCPLKR